MGKTIWTADDDAALAHAVAEHGPRWPLVAAQCGSTASAARMRWLRIAFREHNPCKPKPVTPLPTRPIYRPIRWTDYPSGGRGRYGRSRTGGRPWDFYVLHHPLPSRPLTQRQARLLRLWRLDKPLGRPFMCNLLIAEQRVRLHFLACGVSRAHLNDVVLRTSLCPTTRDSLRLAYMPGDVCHTITRSNANLNWVCTPSGRAGFLTPPELAAFMGLDRRSLLPSVLRAGISGRALMCCLAESVVQRMSLHFAQLATQGLDSLTQWRVGSLFSGAFDSLAEGLCSGHRRAIRVFAAESDEHKARALRQRCIHGTVYPTAEAASQECAQVDALVASPPCIHVSAARCGPADCDPIVHRHVDIICETVLRAQPMIVIIEQSDGLRTHHPSDYSRVCARLDQLPYNWLHRTVCAHRDYSSPHRRSRLVWIGRRR